LVLQIDAAIAIGQDLSIVAFAALLVRVSGWWIRKRGARTSEQRVYFVLLLAGIAATGVLATIRSVDEIQELQKVELLSVKVGNATLQNQQLIKDVLKQGNAIIDQTKHPLFASGNSHLLIGPQQHGRSIIDTGGGI